MTLQASDGYAPGPVSLPRLRLSYRRLVQLVIWLMIFGGSISLIEPSPYDLLGVLAVALFGLSGFRIKRGVILFLTLLTVREIAGFIALIPYLDEPTPVLYQFQSLFLYVTGVFFVLYFSENTIERLDFCLKAYTAGAVFSSLCGLVGYLDIGGTADMFTMYGGRVSGTFKDPNVFGSYVIPAALYLVQILLLGTTRRPVLSFTGLLIILVSVFLSFSRGSWGALVISSMLVVGYAYITADNAATRRRIVVVAAAAIALTVMAILVLLSTEEVREFFLKRASVTQDYDEGETGRFGNQLRSISMLVERPLGFGPLRFRLWFGLEPHSSYINAFASNGWLGGFTFLALVASTCFIGFRMVIRPSPFRRMAQVVWPALLIFLLQGFQIDIDHWRQVFLLFGMVWGVEAARQEWERRELGITSSE